VDREKADVSSVQPRSSGKLPDQIDWSFEAELLRFQGKYEQAAEMKLQALGPRGTMLGKEHTRASTSRQKRCRDHSDPSNTTRTAEKGWIYLTGVVTEPCTNALSNKGAVWIGPGGTYTKTFINNAGEDLICAPMLRVSTITSPSLRLTSPPAHLHPARFRFRLVSAWWRCRCR
jgi:hypothetical protein